MALPWLTRLKSVPWTDVISDAPKVADGAKKLWHTVAKNPLAQAAGGTEVPGTEPATVPSITTLAARLKVMESKTAELHDQMLASSKLIATLAEQNAQLIKLIEVHRRRVLWLGAVTAVLVVMALSGAVKWSGLV